jgi:hypothetical protein
VLLSPVCQVQALSSVLYATSRVPDLPELTTLHKMFAQKYGKVRHSPCSCVIIFMLPIQATAECCVLLHCLCNLRVLQILLSVLLSPSSCVTP